jgi:hypothetical protein
MTETLTIEQLVLDELRAAFTRVAEHIGNDSSLDPNSVLGAPFALFMAERAVCKAFRQFADVEKESTTTREILTRLAALENAIKLVDMLELANRVTALESRSGGELVCCRCGDARCAENNGHSNALFRNGKTAWVCGKCVDDLVAAESAIRLATGDKPAPAPTKRQQVAEAFLHAAETFSLDTEGRYEDLAERIDAQTRKPNTLPRERAMFTAMAAVLEEAAREEQE